MQLANLGIKDFLAIRSMHKQADRDDAVTKFNDPNHPSRTLVTSLRLCATAVNLQRSCCAVVFVDVPTNAQTAAQGVDRFEEILGQVFVKGPFHV